jgi:hypothetical protein
MIDAVYVLGKMGLKPGMSVSRAITAVGIAINDSSDQLKAANRIIVSLGAKPVSNTIMADIFAKALVEQAVVQGASYDADDAFEVANAKYLKIERTMPFVFAGSGESTTPVYGTPVGNGGTKKPKQTNDKKTQALEIFNRETSKGLPNSTIAQTIATELEITLSNAQYYVNRVFVKYSK